MKKRIIAILIALVLCALCSATVFAAGTTYRLVDDADVLTDSEEASLASRLDAISKKYKVDVIVVTVKSLNGKSSDAFASSYYRDNGLGYGKGKDGVMLLFSAEVVDGGRDFLLYTNGVGDDAVGDYLDRINSKIVGYLKSDNFVKAFDVYATECENYIDIEVNGAPFNFFTNLLISLAVGFVIALIVTSVMRGKLKSVRRQANASNYLKSGSFKVTTSRDIFLYRTVTRHARPKSNSSGGGGGSRSRSSGGKC